MAKLFFKYGTMKSGKSMHLLMTAHNYESQGKRVLIYTTSLDDRWGKGKIVSRTGLERNARIFDNDSMLDISSENAKNPISCVLVDECQFLTDRQVMDLAYVATILNIPVVCYGLKNTFDNDLFEGSKSLLVMADSIEQIKTICEHKDCGRKAIMNLRFENGKPVYEGSTIQIGDEEYKPVCRFHYFTPSEWD